MKSIIIFIKAPVPGKVKTRLCPPLSRTQAASLYKAFAKDTLAVVRRVISPRRLEVSYAAEEPYPDIGWLTTRTEIKYFIQKGDDLGERIIQAFNRGFSSGSRKVVVVGSDTPYLKPSQIDRAFEALDRNDVVIGPAQDGGYYLIGLKRPCPALFKNISWSSEKVFSETLARIRQNELRLGTVAGDTDVDTWHDLLALARALQHNKGAAKFTRRALANILSQVPGQAACSMKRAVTFPRVSLLSR